MLHQNTSQPQFYQKFMGLNSSQKLPIFQKVYKIVRLKSSILIIKKFYPVCLEKFLNVFIKDRELHKQFLRTLTLALQNLYTFLQLYQIDHENLKPSNCFLKINNSESDKNTLQIVISDPYLDYHLNEPLSDSEAIGNMMHQIICGRLPI